MSITPLAERDAPGEEPAEGREEDLGHPEPALAERGGGGLGGGGGGAAGAGEEDGGDAREEIGRAHV